MRKLSQNYLEHTLAMKIFKDLNYLTSICILGCGTNFEKFITILWIKYKAGKDYIKFQLGRIVPKLQKFKTNVLKQNMYQNIVLKHTFQPPCEVSVKWSFDSKIFVDFRDAWKRRRKSTNFINFWRQDESISISCILFRFSGYAKVFGGLFLWAA